MRHAITTTLFVFIIGCVFAASAAGPALAQDDEDNGTWLAYFDNGKASKLGWKGDDRLQYWFDAHARFLDDAGGFNQSIVRPGLGWKLNDDLSVWAGYGWIRTSPIAGEDFNENRFWQQGTWTPSMGALKFQFRSRFEQRWLETGDDVGLRLRQLARVQKPINVAPRLTFVAWDEVFFHLNDTDFGADSGFNQNRAFVGLGFKRWGQPKWRTEIGYLNQLINRPGDDQMNHVLSINFFRLR